MAAGVRVTATGVTYAFPGGGAAAVRGVELVAAPGSLTALLGPNGSGKSTLLRLLGGLLAPRAGTISLDRGSEPGLVPHELSRARLARLGTYLPARPEVPPDYTAREVVLMGRHPFGRGLLLESPEDLRRADEALARAGAGAFAARPCDALSSGERQRVLVARALCQGVPLLLLDEPTSAQDLAHAHDLFDLFARLAHDEGRTVVVATHDLNAAARHADRLLVLAEGAVVSRGAPAEVLRADVLERVFAVDAVVGEDAGVPYAVPRGRAGP